MTISPDEIIIWQWQGITLNATILFTWVIMALLVFVSWLITRNLTSDEHISRGQTILEAVVTLVTGQIQEITERNPTRYIPFIGTLFIFIATAAFLSIIPGFRPPTASLSTTTALALCVFFAVPLFGIMEQGVRDYLRQYLQPSPFMLPFNIMGELSRTLALAVRLFGNMMSGTMIVAVLLTIIPLFFPILLEMFSLLIGFIQAYIFSILAMVYIASAVHPHDEAEDSEEPTLPAEHMKGTETHG